MKNKFTGIFIGMILGALMMVSVPAFGAAKQYILTAFTGKVVVNGVEYKDAENPVLNYKGKTYLPLAKIGDLTGVEYRWNAELKQVEIGSKSSTAGPAGRKNDYLKPDTVIEEPEVPGYKGYPDWTDTAIAWAEEYGLPQPPLLSEGWISAGLLQDIEYVKVGLDYEKQDDLTFYRTSVRGIENLALIKLPESFKEGKDSTFEIEGIRIKKWSGYLYFNISDLQKAGIIK